LLHIVGRVLIEFQCMDINYRNFKSSANHYFSEIMAEEKRMQDREHQNITLRDRRKLLITGVHNVESFNEECIVVDTELGIIIVRGLEMHINKLDVESATLDVEGEIGAVEYLDQSAPKRKGGFLSGLFR